MTEILLLPDAFLCRPCVRSLEKLCKLKEELGDKEREIRQLVDCAMGVHALVCGKVTTSPFRKCSASAAETVTPSATANTGYYIYTTVRDKIV